MTRPVLRAAAAVFHLTDDERTELTAVAGPLPNLRSLRNGVPAVTARIDGSSAPPEVLFMARLDARKRPTVFVDAARLVLESGHEARFTLIGPDQGQGDAVKAAIAAGGHCASIRWEGALSPDATTERLSLASVFVLPSRGEPFPMAVLEAMSVGLPVVVTTSCGLAPLITESGSGLVVDESVDSLAGAVRHLLAHDDVRTRMGAHALSAAHTRLGMAPVVTALERAYESAVRTRG